MHDAKEKNEERQKLIIANNHRKYILTCRMMKFHRKFQLSLLHEKQHRNKASIDIQNLFIRLFEVKKNNSEDKNFVG